MMRKVCFKFQIKIQVAVQRDHKITYNSAVRQHNENMGEWIDRLGIAAVECKL